MSNRMLWLGLTFAATTLCPAPVASALVDIEWILVGDPGNAADTPATNCVGATCGAVPYEYRLGMYEVTSGQYVDFLNAKAATDPLGLYEANMGSDPINGGIARSGSIGSYAYAAIRFANWIHNGQGSGDTETGAYTMLGGTPIPSNGTTLTRNPGASVFLPTEHEWYKAASYDAGTATYFAYPAGTSTATACSTPTATANHANCNFAVAAVTDVGAYTGSAGPYGTYDQGGNVYEWNEQIVAVSNRGLRGGSWDYHVIEMSRENPLFDPPTAEFDNFGIRLASPAVAPTPVPVGGRVGLLVAAFLMLTALRAIRGSRSVTLGRGWGTACESPTRAR